MAVTTPKLGIISIDTHNCYTIGMADISQYPENYNITSPTIQITLPFGGYVTLPFTAQSVNIFNSTALRITCADEDLQPLPDGIYQFKYMISPSNLYFVEKTLLVTNQLQEKLDNAYIALDLPCDINEEDAKKISEISLYIGEAISAANSCAKDLSIKMYRKADRMLTNFNNHTCLTCK